MFPPQSLHNGRGSLSKQTLVQILNSKDIGGKNYPVLPKKTKEKL